MDESTCIYMHCGIVPSPLPPNTLVKWQSKTHTSVIYTHSDCLCNNTKGVFFFFMLSKTHKITYTAILSALSVVANIFSIQMLGTSNYLSFAYIPTFIAGIYLGVWSGGMVGLVGDVLGCLIMPQGVWNPIITLATMLLGVLPALVWKVTTNTNWHNIYKLVLSLMLCGIVCTSGLNTLGLWLMYGNGKGYCIYLVARLPFQLLMISVNGILLQILLSTKVIDKLLPQHHTDSNQPMQSE